MYQRKANQAYQQVSLESEIANATPYQLIQILFKGALSALKRGEIFMEQGNIAEKGKEISKAIDIIDTGLKQSLNYEAGGELAENLASLYEYMTRQLLRANIENNVTYVQEVYQLLSDIASAWQQIGANVDER
ncbi:TPA: flagellar export chaperone FliS [Providencia alcalifaciens]|jgi:flagellar protein FliS|uniref:Flagellar secretion chaperone FliS n=4 Tax=Providencia TaxID=586 RepID=A0A291EET2_9GAMM|nr:MULTISPECIES: flagellar export chaperone FliS [Providencia]MTC75970.1 flagellar export chaperone FliS [Providencia sp. wls1919]ATG17824.1 flagella export chaperone FliS [Providencia alcalifaciens]EEB47390.1 flagellar protein FliS [Providencia alcalifaciens DSM 30120]EKT66392.1 flagellar protein FliS [Providencia alcalifaciens Dmel2]ETT00677.1 flagellar protein FliS [Providencia alcalifaciens PAL-3]